MSKGLIRAGVGAAALLAAAIAFVPASGAPEVNRKVGLDPAAMRGSVGYFTPAAADPKLAQLYANGALSNHGFRFTPVSDGRSRAVTVAVRAAIGRSASGEAALARSRIAPQLDAAPAANGKGEAGIKPVSYSLGSAVGWKRFAAPVKSPEFDPTALAAAKAKLATGIVRLPSKWDTNVRVAADQQLGQTPGTLSGAKNMSVDVGGSYRLTRKLDLTAGVRIRSDRDRLTQQADPRRDSQAVYVGTTFRF